MEDLREAVDALDHYLDAVELVRASFDTLPGREEREQSPGEEASTTSTLTPEAWSGQPSVSHPASSVSHPEKGPTFPRFRDRATGLYTRAGFDAVTEGELKRCARHSRLFSLLLIQPSGPAGLDLPGAAKTVRGALRASDLVGSEGGQLLLIGLPETSTADTREIAARLVAALEAEGAWDAGGRLGVSTRATNGGSVSDLIDSARSQLMLTSERVLTDVSPAGYEP